ncbi:MAG: polysaccharide deacetylase family protein [Tissierellia bacterium]|nr:polysaccharide deacetylase family protein [Tissierellia bacterium]
MRRLANDIHKLFNMAIVAILLLIISIINSYPKAIYVSIDTNQAVFSKGTKKQKVIALSFDDGPHPKYTIEILDILKEYDIKATFFVLGMHAEKYPEIIKRQVEEGHEIGNHSYSHINMRKATKKQIREEFEKTQEIIYSIAKIRPKVFRPPYGNYNRDVIEIISSDDIPIVLWTFYQDSKDWSNPGVDSIVNTTLSKVQNGDIILFHDYVYKNESHTVEALKIIIPELLNKGYKFVTISELLNISRDI